MTASTHDERMALREPLPADDQAARLYPDNAYLQDEWRRAVDVVRSTSRGWLLDRAVVRQGQRRA